MNADKNRNLIRSTVLNKCDYLLSNELFFKLFSRILPHLGRLGKMGASYVFSFEECTIAPLP